MEDDNRNFLRIARAPGKRQIKPTAVAFQATVDEREDDSDFSGEDSDETDSLSGTSGIEDDDVKDEQAYVNASTMDDKLDEDDIELPDVEPCQTKEESDPPICCICLKLDTEHLKILKCAGCNIFVHDYCYGITKDGDAFKDSSTGEHNLFFCEPCLFGLKEPPYCELCPSRYGAFKKTDIGSNWVHVICGQYVRNITYACTKKFVGISYQEVDHKLFGKKVCDGCKDVLEKRTGIVVPCEAGFCKHNYHTTCAQRLGLLVERGWDDNENENHGHLLCKRHSALEIVKYRKKMYGKMIAQEEKRMIQIKRRKISEEYLVEKQKQLDNWQQIIDKDEFNNVVYPNPKTPKRIRMLQTSAEFMDGFALKAEMAFGISRDKFGKEIAEIPTENLNLGDAFSFTTDSTRHFDYREDVLIAELESRAEELKVMQEDALQRVEDEKQELLNIGKNTQATKSSAKQSIDLCNDFVDSLNSFGAKKIEKVFRDIAGTQKSTAFHSKSTKSQKMEGNNENIPLVPILGSSKDIKTSSQIRKRPVRNSYSFAPEVLKVCLKCKKDTDMHQMLFCDTCKGYFHIGCLDPPLTKMPKRSRFFTFKCSDCCGDDALAKKGLIESAAAMEGSRPKRSKRK